MRRQEINPCSKTRRLKTSVGGSRLYNLSIINLMNNACRLTNMGYDYLAIHTMLCRGHITAVGRQIGVGKESDIFEVTNDEGETFALKLHRLGRTSFRAVKNKRDYLGKRQNFSWLYLSRLAALKEFAFMRALGEHGFPVPQAIDSNRHAVLMTLLSSSKPLVQFRRLQNPAQVYLTCMELIGRLASKGLVHCDFNEFNLLINEETEEVTVIDFPQMVSVNHANAKELFERDVECIIRFFTKKIGYMPDQDKSLPYVRPCFETAVSEIDESLDVDLAASGFKRQHQQALDEWLASNENKEGEEEEEEEGGEEVEEGLIVEGGRDPHDEVSTEMPHRTVRQPPHDEVSTEMPVETLAEGGGPQVVMSLNGDIKGDEEGDKDVGDLVDEQEEDEDDDDDDEEEEIPESTCYGRESRREGGKSRRAAASTIVLPMGEKEVQQILVNQRKRQQKQEQITRAMAKKNTSKASKRGGKASGGVTGNGQLASFGGW